MAHSAGRRGAAMLAAMGVSVPGSATKKSEETTEQLLSERTPSKARASARVLSPTKSPLAPPAVAADSPGAAIDTSRLPAELQQLISVFESMLTGRGLLKRRGEKTTHQNLSTVVERMTGKAFKVQHLQQIKHLYPEAFEWQYIRHPSAQDASKLEYQLLLSFDTLASAFAAPAEDSGAGRTRDAAARATFKQRLLAWYDQATQPAAGTAASLQPEGNGSAARPQVPLVPIPSKENAPRVGGSPGMTRSMGGSMGRVASASSPTMSRAPSAGLSGISASVLQQQQAPGGGGLLLPPKSPALARLFSSGAGPAGRAGVPPPSPTRSGRPPPTPTSHGPRGGLLSRGASSILDVLPAGQNGGPAACSPIPASPTSHLKRKAQATSPPDGVPSPTSTARTEPRRRRLMLADSPDNKQQAQAADNAGAAAASPARQAGSNLNFDPTPKKQNTGDGDLSPTMRARLAQSAAEEEEEERRQAGAAATPSAGASQRGLGPASPGVSNAGVAQPSPSVRSRNSLLSRFMSEEAMQELRRNSDAAPANAAQAAESTRAHATSMMPAAMDLLRSIYGLKGPVVKPHDEVVELMRQKSSANSGFSSAEARLTLELMVAAVPEYASVEEQGGVKMFRVNRSASIKTVRDKLRDQAAAARRAVSGSAPPSPAPPAPNMT